ncbi:tRNA(His) guanylyltransferase [Heracleum sosnowskyi]|uniref:tRNA(His) guanylyltransferase n=1 Tax=Heracleum sosnowskyi TaxID=360622 RepID=A0AAD8JKM8_9APIA|nr:tRNA(His) guanylyltransferase [Heracleum sosnowskyi]
MANSKYEYVKIDYEVNDEVMFPNLIVVRIHFCNFTRFSQVHEFEQPNDENALNLMNACATAVLKEYPDIVFSYGFGDEYSFVFSKDTNFYQRRASKILSLIVSFFTSNFVMNWKYWFPQKELKSLPLFQSRIICCASVEVLQAYLAWRQRECHTENQHNTCLWNLVKSGKTELEAQEILKGTLKQDKNELLFQQFKINYKLINKMFRQGSCVLKTEIEAIVKYINDTPVKRLRKNVTVEHSENIASRNFWNKHSCLVKEISNFIVDINNIKPEFVKSFTFENKLMLSTWIVVRIDGCHFHRFSEIHEFEKPNDEQALNLMNSCAVAVLKEFNDIVFSYGVSDEYSFVLKKDSQLYQRCASYIVSAIVSLFSAVYVMQWVHFFPSKELKYTPCFDGRAVCYPSSKILQDYLAWRQVDCHINNQYNTCFWELVKSGRTKREAQKFLKGTQTNEKYDLLAQQFHIDYNRLPIMFRRGSSVFREQDKDTSNEEVEGETQNRVVIKHCNIIDCSFWEANPSILNKVPL